MKAYYNGEPLSFGSSGGGSGGGVPIGTIVIWSGTAENVPAGWHICDGTNGTPDLRDKFVLGAGENHPIGEEGGEEEVTLTVEQMPSHAHSLYRVTSTGTGSGIQKGGSGGTDSSVGVNNTGGSKPHPNMPPYYALCYIQKIAPDETDGGEVYSEEETVIGTWFDKPLYKRVIVGIVTEGTYVASNAFDTLVDSSVLKVIEQTGYIDLGNGYTCVIPWPFEMGNQFQFLTKDGVGLCIRSDKTFLGMQYFACLKYTKTTD